MIYRQLFFNMSNKTDATSWTGTFYSSETPDSTPVL